MRQKPHNFQFKEVSTMALSNILGWDEDKKIGSACGTGCGASDNNASGGSMEEKPTACGSACGASDNNASGGSVEEKPAACGSACGASDK